MVYAVLILIALAIRGIGDFRPTQYILAEAIVFGWLWLRQKNWFDDYPLLNRLLIWIAGAVAVGFYLRADVPIKLAILFGTIILVRRGNDARRQKSDWILPALAVYSITWMVLCSWPVTYNFLRKFSFWYSGLFSALSPAGLQLGPTAAGWGIILAGVVFVLVLHFYSSRARWGNTLAGVAFVLLGQPIFWALAYPMIAGIAGWISVTMAAFIHLSVFYLLWVVVVMFVMTRVHRPDRDSGVSRRLQPGWLWPALGALTVLAVLFAGPFSSSGGEHKRILILNADKLDTMTPNFTRFGDRSGGMFGMLPQFCEGLGYDIRRANVTPEIFDSIDVIIFANLIDSLPRWQRDSVLSFVRQGGGLLALADHTGYTAIRGPTNDITEPMGLSLNFDTAVPLRRSWVGEMQFHPSRITQSVTRHSDIEVWLGASVEPSPGAMPLVVGTHAFSDPGNVANKERSYLGNLEYDAGEPLGDVVIVGAAYYGAGRAVLIGDTSPFQNGALVKSHRFAARTLAWLAGGGNAGWDNLRLWGFPLVLIIAGLLVFLFGKQPIRGAWLLVLLPVVSVSLWNLTPAGEPDSWNDELFRLAYIDASHGEVYDLMGWEKYSIGGLEFNLMRNGYQPELRRDWQPGWLKKADLVIIARPTQPITRPEIDDLVAYIEQGGWVLVAAGFEEHAAVEKLLAEFDLKIENIPLGRAEGRGLGQKVIFARAYPITSTNDNTRTLCEASRMPLVSATRRGKGGLIVIGDPVFLFNSNLENRGDDYIIENIRFFRELMRATSGTTAAAGGGTP